MWPRLARSTTSPRTPDMNGMVVEEAGMPEAVISWAEVEVDDYFYTTVTNLATGFEATVYSDTGGGCVG